MLKRIGLAVGVLLTVTLVGSVVFGAALVRRSWPQHGGEITLAGLDGPVEVIRDSLGVPHVYAESARDLFRAQGFVTAQDRFFQMDLRRHTASGTLAELVGPDGIESDMVVRTLGWRRIAEAELPKLAPATRQYLTAYAEGVNDYLDRRTEPSDLGLEYVVLGLSSPDYRVEPWDEIDSLVWLKAMAWDLKANYQHELARARLSATLSRQQVAVLYPPFPATEHRPILSTVDWSPHQDSAASIVPPALTDIASVPGTPTAAPPGIQPSVVAAPGWSAVRAAPSTLWTSTDWALSGLSDLGGRSTTMSSNSWVVGPDRSSTGKPILANDPHLGVGIPDVWYQVGLHCRNVDATCPFEVAGFSLAGVPGIIIGHNARIAWAMSSLGADVTDFFLEKLTDTAYMRDGQPMPLQVRTETIRVRGGDDVHLQVRSTDHGPILSEVSEQVAAAGRRPVIGGVVQQEALAVSIAWSGLEPGTTADAIFALDAAEDFASFRDAARSFVAPALSLLYADVEGNIGYQSAGLVPVRRASTPGTKPGYLPSPGSDSQWDWQGWVPFDDMPWALNPRAGFIVAADQMVSTSSTPFLSAEWDPGWRSDRIRDLLTGQQTLGVTDLQAIQADTRNDFAPTLVAALLRIDLSDDPFTAEAQDLLRTWDCTSPVDQQPAAAAAAYYAAVWARLLERTFDDELPDDLRADGGARWQSAVAALLDHSNDPWWDDKSTPSVIESRDVILSDALVQARLDLTRQVSSDVDKWSWGKLHSVTLTHPVLDGERASGLAQAMAGGGPVPVGGGPGAVSAFDWLAESGSYTVTSAPSMRMIVDLADFDSSTWVAQAGVSGHPYADHYGDQVGAWAAGTGYPWPFTKDAVIADQSDELRFVPQA